MSEFEYRTVRSECVDGIRTITLNRPQSLNAMNRWAELHEIQGAALFLASDASTFVTGASLYVDGGWAAK